MKGLRLRAFIVLSTVLFSIYLLIPTYIRFTSGKVIPRVPKAEDPWYYHVIPSETLKLGLDLMGGLHLVLGIDFNEVHRDAVTKMKNQMKDVLEREKLTGVTFDVSADNHIVAHFQKEEDWKKADSVIGKDLGTLVDFQGLTGNEAKFTLTPTYEHEVNNRAVEQSLETLRNRIDEFGIAEPILQRQGDEKILVQFPGIQEPGRLKEIIARTAKLSFQVVKTGLETQEGTVTSAQLSGWVEEYKKAKNIKTDASNPISKYLRDFNSWLVGKIPADQEVVFHRKMNINTHDTDYIPYLLEKESLVTGEDLQDAFYSYDQNTNLPEVNFRLTPVGATKFEKATEAHVGQYMAIVLDNNVHSAPRIREKIGGGSARIEMGSTGRAADEILKDAKDTALVLRSGALPARLEFLEERVIGPSLGADAIRSGTISLAVGLLAVFIFMSIYYRGSGVIANLALLLNGLFIMSVMAAFEGTLTLPGLAGVTLTLGMAVDANVLIFEHMREELRHGKSIAFAVSEGYHRALSAILDSNLTTMIAGIVLLSFGYGPIRGFAVTLLIGLTASMFTAVFVTRVVFDWLIVSKNKQTISL